MGEGKEKKGSDARNKRHKMKTNNPHQQARKMGKCKTVWICVLMLCLFGPYALMLVGLPNLTIKYFNNGPISNLPFTTSLALFSFGCED